MCQHKSVCLNDILHLHTDKNMSHDQDERQHTMEHDHSGTVHPTPKGEHHKISGGNSESKTQVGVLCTLKKNENAHVWSCAVWDCFCTKQMTSVGASRVWPTPTMHGRDNIGISRVLFMDYHIQMMRHLCSLISRQPFFFCPHAGGARTPANRGSTAKKCSACDVVQLPRAFM